MADSTMSPDLLNFEDAGKKKIPSTLNVLTILTIVGSVFKFIAEIRSYYTGENRLKLLRERSAHLQQDSSAWIKRLNSPQMIEIVQNEVANKLPLLILGILCSGVSFYAATEMRKLKQRGYWIWLVGAFLPLIGTVLFIGPVFFEMYGWVVMIIQLAFIILYSAQRKYLVN